MRYILPKLGFILLIGISMPLFGQKDTLHRQEKSLFKYKPTFAINADFRQTFVKNSPITLYGGYVGTRFKDKHLFSLGYYWLSDSSKLSYKAQNRKQAAPAIEVNEEVSLWFLSLGYTRTIYEGKVFKIDIPVEVGIGEGSSGVYDNDGKLLRLTTGGVVPLQAGVSAIVKVTRWFGVHLQAGHREILGKSLFQNQYTGLYYTYGISFNFGTIYQELKK
jgi:hypothetical protein